LDVFDFHDSRTHVDLYLLAPWVHLKTEMRKWETGPSDISGCIKLLNPLGVRCMFSLQDDRYPAFLMLKCLAMKGYIPVFRNTIVAKCMFCSIINDVLSDPVFTRLAAKWLRKAMAHLHQFSGPGDIECQSIAFCLAGFPATTKTTFIIFLFILWL